MKNILTILSFILCFNGFSQSLYIPSNPDSIKVPVNVNGAVRTVYNIDLVKYRAALTARDTAAALRLLINSSYQSATTLPDSTGFTLNRQNGTKDTIQISIPPTVDTLNKWVNTVYKVPGKDSIYFKIGGSTYAIKDSTVAGGGIDATALHKTGDETVTSGSKTFSSPFTVTGTGSGLWSPMKITSAYTSGNTTDTLAGIYINQNFGTTPSLNKWGVYSNRDFNVNGVRIGNGNSSDGTNVVFGNGALNAVTTGTANGHVAIGFQSFKSANNTSFFNTGVGYATGSPITSGTYNTAIGGNSLATATATVAQNTSVGANSLYAATGSNNVAVGYNAGRNAGTAGIFLGNSAGQNEAGSNKLYINNTINGGLIVGDFSTGQVQINAESRNDKAAGSLSAAASFEVNNNPSLGYRGSMPAVRMTQADRDKIALQTGVVTKIYVVNGGGATSAPTVAISGSGTGATATATFTNGGFFITVTNGGTGYTPNSTTVTLTGGGITGTPVAYAVVGNSGLSVYCLDCTATDASIGVLQYWNGSTWKNAW